MEARGFTIDNTGGRVSVVHPVYGEVASKSAEVYRRQLHEVDVHRAAIEFAEANAKAFAEWFFTGSEDA
jgi:hypothetical protein